MIGLDITSNAREVERWLGSVGRDQFPFALARGLTGAAKAGADAFGRELTRSLDRPTPFTLKAPYIVPAKKRDLVAHVRVRDRQDAYLSTLVEGGTRLPTGRALLIPAGARLNRYGNLPRGAVQRMLARPGVFSGTIGGVAGIWQRQRRGGAKLLIAFADRAEYRPQLDFDGSIRRVVERELPGLIERYLVEAIRSAK